jgi:hypothetical protein
LVPDSLAGLANNSDAGARSTQFQLDQFKQVRFGAGVSALCPQVEQASYRQNISSRESGQLLHLLVFPNLESALKITVELDDATPNCIGSYRILHKIGAGGMGTVYAALGSRLGHGVLQIELLHPTTAASPIVIFTRFGR